MPDLQEEGMHDHTVRMQETHRGLDGNDVPVTVEVRIRHDHGPMSTMEDHDHPVTVAITQEEATVTLEHPAPFPSAGGTV